MRKAADGPWDHLIVGGGSAGCVLANRLTERGDRNVLLIEAGGEDRSPFIRVPAGMPRLGTRHDWRYPAEPDASRHDTLTFWAQGKVLGGSSSINAMLWVRGHPADFDGWAEAGCPGWDHASVLPYFRRAETYAEGPSAHRGAHGPQHVSRNRVDHELTDAFIAAAVEQGHPYNDDYNGEHQEGVAYTQVSQKRGWRHSAARAYLAPARRRRNLAVETHATVTRVIWEGDRAVGVEYRKGSRTHEVRCRRDVILSAGAIASPTLLLRSGIGPAAHLREHGIDVVADLPGVGRNLQDHPVAMLAFGVTSRTLNQELTPRRAAVHGLDFALRGRGPVSSAIAHAQVFDHAPDGGAATDYQMIFAPFGVSGVGGKTSGTTDGGEHWHDIHAVQLVETSTVMAFVPFLHPRSRGEIRLRSADPEDMPVIDHQLLGDRRDLDDLVEACRRVRHIMAAKALRPHVVAEELPGPQVDTDAEWEEHLRDAAFGAYHQSGTCRMGSDDEAVVDPDLRVRGVAGLRVVDASVMPTVTSGNTNAPTIMIAEKASDLVRS